MPDSCRFCRTDNASWIRDISFGTEDVELFYICIFSQLMPSVNDDDTRPTSIQSKTIMTEPDMELAKASLKSANVAY